TFRLAQPPRSTAPGHRRPFARPSARLFRLRFRSKTCVGLSDPTYPAWQQIRKPVRAKKRYRRREWVVECRLTTGETFQLMQSMLESVNTDGTVHLCRANQPVFPSVFVLNWCEPT